MVYYYNQNMFTHICYKRVKAFVFWLYCIELEDLTFIVNVDAAAANIVNRNFNIKT